MGFADSFESTTGRLLSLRLIAPYSDALQRYGVEQNLLGLYSGRGIGSVDIHAGHSGNPLREKGIVQNPIGCQH